jgi:hypothetical protein
LAHFGVPQIVSITSIPWRPALRTNSSRSENRYALSNGLAAFRGLFSAMRDQ